MSFIFFLKQEVTLTISESFSFNPNVKNVLFDSKSTQFDFKIVLFDMNVIPLFHFSLFEFVYS